MFDNVLMFPRHPGIAQTCKSALRIGIKCCFFLLFETPADFLELLKVGFGLNENGHAVLIIVGVTGVATRHCFLEVATVRLEVRLDPADIVCVLVVGWCAVVHVLKYHFVVHAEF